MSRIKLIFEGNGVALKGSIQHLPAGFVHGLLGHNEYHDSFSNYAISPIIGSHYDKESGLIVFDEHPYIFVSSPNEKFMCELAMQISKAFNAYMGAMKLSSIFETNFHVHEDYDIALTVGPILLKTKGDKIVTFQDDNFEEILTNNCIQKLIKNGMDEGKAKTLKISLINKDKAKIKKVFVHKVTNITSQVMLRISGDREARRMIYEMGLGKSTGCGFGTVVTLKK